MSNFLKRILQFLRELLLPKNFVIVFFLYPPEKLTTKFRMKCKNVVRNELKNKALVIAYTFIKCFFFFLPLNSPYFKL